MECRELTDYAVDRLLGEAAAPERDELERHLAGCGSCSRELAALEETWGELGTDRDDPVTPEFRVRTLELLEDEMSRRRIREFHPRKRALRIFAQAAALAVAAAAGFLVAARGGFPARPVSAGSPLEPAAGANTAPDLAVNPRLSNVAYRTEPDGRVGIEFDSTTRHSVLGRPEDPQISRLLAYLLSLNVQTAGEKSRAIELVSGHSGPGGASGRDEKPGTDHGFIPTPCFSNLWFCETVVCPLFPVAPPGHRRGADVDRRRHTPRRGDRQPDRTDLRDARARHRGADRKRLR